MKKNKILSLLLVSVSMFIISCQKEGPAGPAGPAGATGAAGPAGSAGPAGTANVIYSAWFTPTAWTSPGLSSSDYSFDKSASGITQSIIDNGVVLTYAKLANDNSVVRTLPTTVFNSNGYHFYNYLIPSAGAIRYTYIYTTSPDIPSTTSQFRYIIIPGGVAGGRMRDPRTMSYHEVCQTYGIPE